MVTNIALPRFAKIGAGAADTLGEVIADLGISRPVLVTDRYLVETGQAERLAKTLHAAGSTAAVFSDTVPDPTVESLSAGLELVRAHRADGIIGFGGGSPMDTAKALAVLSANGGDIASYKAPSSYTGPALPIVAVPTTAGSGSEATQFTVITTARPTRRCCALGCRSCRSRSWWITN